jgi:hypothetical protein
MDYRTNPVGIDFIADTNFAATKQVLDLIKDGYIGYRSQLDAASLLDYEAEPNPAMYVQLLSNVLEFAVPQSDDGETQTTELSNTYNLVTFPQGSQYTALSIDVGSAYITSQTSYAEDCLRFISTLTERPDLFSGMPARRSIINSDIVRSVDGDEAVAFYNELDHIMQGSDNVIFPSQTGFNSSQLGDTIAQIWLSRAFDRYVFDDLDLMSELIDAEQYTKDYLACIQEIEPYDPSADSDLFDFVGEYIDCATAVDSTTSSYFAAFQRE